MGYELWAIVVEQQFMGVIDGKKSHGRKKQAKAKVSGETAQPLSALWAFTRFPPAFWDLPVVFP
jgi:hypothetical protein